MYQGHNCILGVLFCFASQAAVACVNPELSQRDYHAIGVVKNTDGEVVYQEHHSHKADDTGGESQVEYKSPDDKLIAQKTINYNCRASAPNYTLTMNQRDGWVEQVKWQSQSLVITQPDGKKIIEAVDSSSLVIDAGFDNFVFENWQVLTSGNQMDIDFLHVPGNRVFELVIKLDTDNPDADASDKVSYFKITPKNKLFRLFTDPIYLGYNRQTKRLDYYSGPTNLRGEIKGLENSKQIAIKYRYN